MTVTLKSASRATKSTKKKKTQNMMDDTIDKSRKKILVWPSGS